MKPRLYVIAGPNGAGKTTFARKFLPLFTKSREFVNADEIAARLSPADPAAAAIQAGREMLKRIGELAEQRVDFCIETTLAGKSYLPLFRKLNLQGYEIHLYFLSVSDVELAIARVADRVRKGGHDIPRDVIRRRHRAGINNLIHHYRPILDSWTLFDNSGPILYCISMETGGRLVVLDERAFARFMESDKDITGGSLEERAEIPEWIKGVAAMRAALMEVAAEHARTGHPLLAWRNGRLFRLPPEDARRELELAERSDPWTAKLLEAKR